MTQRILVIDDDQQIVRLVRSYLEQAGYSVLTAFEGEQALRLIRSERPDLVVLDLMLPGRDGWAITRSVRADPHLAATPIVMLTVRIADTDAIGGLELGADDYITKPFNPQAVVARVRAVLRRTAGGLTLPHILQRHNLCLDLDRHTLTLEDAPIELTPSEFELLKTLMEQPGHVFTRLELIEQGLGYSYEGLERTVDSHIKNLRRKIEPDPATPIIIWPAHRWSQI